MENNNRYKKIDDELLSYVMNVFEKTHYITTDSRKVTEDCIFLAIKGEKYDANAFAKEALDNKAALVIIDNEEYYIDERTILVENSIQFLQMFARYYRNTFDIPFLAISGTNGKTTTKELINAVLSKKYKVQATQGNYNNQIGVPLTVLSLDRDCGIAVIEMGASHPGDIDELCNIADPDIALLTNIGTAHIEGFGSVEGIVQTKTELYRYVENKKGKIFVNIDDANLLKHKPLTAATYSLQKHADITGKIKTYKDFYAAVETDGVTVNSSLVGAYNCYNILAAIAVGRYFGVDMADIKHAIEDYIPKNNRSQIKKTDKNTLILDCYNANPSSCAYALQAFDEIKSEDKRIFIGSMKELGVESEEQHLRIADMIFAMKNIKQIIFVGKEYKEISASRNCLWFVNSGEARDFLQTQNIQNSLILIKGSRATQMEKIADVL